MSNLSDFYAAITKPNPVVKNTFIVRITLEHWVTRESGLIHLQKTLGSTVLFSSTDKTKAEEAFVSREGVFMKEDESDGQ